jgi:oligoribonuclease
VGDGLDNKDKKNEKKDPMSIPLVWMDLEMTGLDPDADTIIEIATIITDGNLKIIASGPNLIIHQEPERFEKMDDWNKEHHTKSGLWQAVVKSTITLKDAERQTFEFIKNHCKVNESPLCGNSVWQDRRFLVRYMPSIDDFLHYRLVDVSTIKELAARWFPKIEPEKPKDSAHRALDDIKESIDELIFYRQNVFKPSK